VISGRHETLTDIAAVVYAEVRPCAADLPCAAGRLRSVALADPAPIQELRVRTFDTFQVIDPRVKTARPVTIVDIDERSLADPRLGPWPRTRIADIINNLTRFGADQFVFAPTSETAAVQHTITDLPRGWTRSIFGNIGSFANVTEAQQGNDTLITLDRHDSVLLKNVIAANLHANDFIISPHGS
jgi:hypothetical protein